MTAATNDNQSTPEETEEVLDLVVGWLDHWMDMMTEADADAHIGDFVTSVQDLLETMLKVMAKHGPIADDALALIEGGDIFDSILEKTIH